MNISSLQKVSSFITDATDAKQRPRHRQVANTTIIRFFLILMGIGPQGPKHLSKAPNHSRVARTFFGAALENVDD